MTTQELAVFQFFEAWYLGHISWAKHEIREAKQVRKDYEDRKLLVPRTPKPFDNWRG